LVKSKYDEALFYWRHEGRCEGVLAIHVDDFLYGGSTKFENLIQNNKTIFTVGSEETVPMKYLGMNIDESDHDIYISIKTRTLTVWTKLKFRTRLTSPEF
jgi:hypothetical protein